MIRFSLPIRFLLATIAILFGLTLLMWNILEPSFSARAEPLSNPRRQTLTPRAYLPLVMRNYCGESGKCWSGVHLGNRTNDWNSTFLQRIDPALGGKWPRTVAVLSNQVYQISRYPSSDPTYPCRVQSASVRHPVIFDYIK